MNTSGGPISKLCREYKIKAEELLVIHDELDIPAGDVRVKVGGGHAGHNGLRSIIDKMGSRDFSRIRTGIGNPPGKMAVATTCLSSCAPARPRISRTPVPARPTPPAWRSCTAWSMPATTSTVPPPPTASTKTYHLGAGFWQVLPAETPQLRHHDKPRAAIHA